MPIPSNSITPRAIRAIMQAYLLDASPPQAIVAALKVLLRERVNAPDQPAAASAPTPDPRFPESTP